MLNPSIFLAGPLLKGNGDGFSPHHPANTMSFGTEIQDFTTIAGQTHNKLIGLAEDVRRIRHGWTILIIFHPIPISSRVNETIYHVSIWTEEEKIDEKQIFQGIPATSRECIAAMATSMHDSRGCPAKSKASG
eukprot:scaffold6397_cov103-Cylindrotheca_fusiformis.AAC.1